MNGGGDLIILTHSNRTDMNTLLYNRIFFVLISCLLSLSGIYSQSIVINLAGQEEVQSAIENFTDQILIQTINNTGFDQNVYFEIVITGNTSLGAVRLDNHLTASSNETLIPLSGTSFSLSTLIEDYQNSTLEDFTITPPALITQLQRDRHLPAGEYRICLEARSVVDGSLLSLPGENNCLTVHVIYRDPPNIETPMHNTWVGESDFDEIQFIWSLSSQQADDRFTVELVRFSSPYQANDFIEQGRPQHMFNTFERIFIEEGVTSWTFNSIQADILPELNPGDILAVRVTATSESSVFLNNGFSEINVFIYGVPNGVLCQNPSVFAEFVYPSPGDTLPFPRIFHVARFHPECDNIIEFEGEMNFYRTDASGTPHTIGPITYSDNWRSGPGHSRFLRQYFSRHFPGEMDFFYPINSDYAAYLPLLNDNNDSRFLAERGDKIYATGRVDFTIQDLTSHHESVQSISLSGLAGSPSVIGMPRPRLQSPENDAILPPGQIDFTFSTGLEPNNPLPPFKIFKIQGSEEPVIPGLQVMEKCVLQVSTQNTFLPNEIVFCQLKKVQSNPYNNGDIFQEDNPVFGTFSPTFDLTPNRLFDQDHFIQSVYKEMNIHHDFPEEDTLYWRVVWLKNPSSYNTNSPCGSGVSISVTDIYHASPVRRFIISNEIVTTSENEDETQYCAFLYPEEDLPLNGEDTPSECASPCQFPGLTSSTPSGTVQGDSTFTAAGFTVEVNEASPGSMSNGNGFVVIPFLNNLKLRVRFNGIQLNADRQMIAGTITPEVESSFDLTRHISTIGTLFNMGETEADALEASLEAGNKLLSLLGNGSEVSLPIGIDKMIGSTRIIIGITEMTFKKDTAHLNMVVNIRIPNLQELNGFISMGAQVCITNEGFGNDVRLYLPQDLVFPMGGTNEFRIKGAEGATNINIITSVEWDCSGFQALNIVGAVRFTRDWLLPEDDHGIILPSGQVEGRFAGRMTKGGNVLIRMDMDDFQIPGVEGWGFSPAENVWIDLSDIENPTGLTAAIPEGYVHPALEDSNMGKTWKGFFMEAVSIKAPAYLQGPDHNRLTFAVRNLFIDHTGISFKLNAENILRWDGSGDMNGWAASLDTIFLHIVQNNFRSFGFNGKLGLPIAESTQYLKYEAALVHDEGNFNLVVSVRPAANLNIPISMASAVIERGSYVELSLGHDSYIEANLCALLTIGNENLSEGQSMPATLQMPGIRIQNLRVNSETGLDTTDFSYALTGLGGLGSTGRSGAGDAFEEDEFALYEELPSGSSGESSLSGFPIGLDHFSFSNDKITIQPRITLTGGENGFSAAAKISLLINMDLTSSPQRFDVTGVQLERIDLSIETSEITLDGYLEFYKTGTDEGVKGGITLEISMGTKIGVNINADFGSRKMPGATAFNTENWFSYFYVDGMVYLSSGITLFSGVSLFGLGGGFYHHMLPTGSLPTGASVAGASGAGSSSSSGVLYRPDFRNDLGLKFMVILGSNDQGKAYNLDVKLEATFSFRYGLTMLRFEGSFRVMTDGISITTIGRESRNSPISGYVNMTLDLPPLAPATFNGQFFVKLKVMPEFTVLKGLGRLDSVPPGWTQENAMVWATFYAGPDKWFFYMGTPTNRCGVSLQIGGQELLRVTNYMMIGHGIPVILPEPDSEFVMIFEKGMDPSAEFEGSDGDINTMLAGQPRQNTPLGTGFAFGMTMVLNTGDVSIFPFYFALKAVMGCDINVTQASASAERRCAGTGIVPGMDGWYATGQFYAGIEGSFGILIPLFVTEIRATILEASAAMILQGGLPNPEWVSGRGSFYYNVCDGLAEGRCSFELTVGTVCNPVTGNPFAGIKMIQDISPADGSTEVSVYTKVSAAFSMEMDHTYEIEEYTGPTNPPVIRRLQPYMHTFELLKQGSSRSLTFSTREWSENNHVFTAHPTDRLDARNQFTVRVTARVRENSRDMESQGRIYEEELSHTFTTGDEPDKIVEENLSFTYPYITQQTFFKGETRNNKGYIRCIQGNNECLKPLGDVTNIERRWYARFTSENGHTFISPVTVMPHYFGVIFDVANCQDNTIYCLQVIREDKPRSTMPQVNLSGAERNAIQNPASGYLNNHIRQLQITNFSASIGASTILSNQFKQIKLPSEQVKEYETQLYAYYFKTSRYHTMEQKLTAERSGWDQDRATFGVTVYTIKKDMTETFEWVDNQTFTVLPSSGKVFTKRLVFRAEPLQILDGLLIPGDFPPNQYLRDIINPRVIGQWNLATYYRENLRRRVESTNPGMAVSVPVIGLIDGFTRYDQWMYIKNQSSLYGPLSLSTIQNAFNPDNIRIAGVASNPNVGILTGGLQINTGMHTMNTQIGYELTVEGLRHYKQLRNTLIRFLAGQVSIRIPGGVSTISVDELLNDSERIFFRRHANNSPFLSQCNHINFTKGPQTIGMQYLYPDQNGNDVKGSKFTFNFSL